MDVKIEDREKEVEYARIALAACELYLKYEHVDLISDVIKNVNKKGGELSLIDCARIFTNWKIRWEEYDEKHKET